LPSPDDAMRRPLCLFADPVPLSVAWHEGSFRKIVTTQQLPQRIRLAGVVHTVTRHWGPERIETGWWKGPTVRRDYYRIETDRGCWWWVFRNLDAPNSRGRYRWMLHGRFD
jgi:protein ImuB